ncbi:MAG: MATE family efflux transporter [Muribaculaceae bacterium]|nr:MATE family efflux transporter [Roseburia sp.]MCM1430015.1 MATE family efflux transporter [Muribaculaceae bacterium]MCM1492958.1 MATE family efflux transporter [Muribaculaceae bacterium]
MNKTSKASQVDLLHGPIFGPMVRFAIPLFLSSIFQQLYNTVDTVIVGHTLGEASLAAMGAATPVYDLLIGFAFGIGGGLSIVTARSYGSKDENLLKRSVASSLVIAAVITVVLTLLTRVILMPFLRLLNTPPEIIDEAHRYVSAITLFMGVMFAYNLCSGMLRAIGNSVMPLVFLVVSSVSNIGLDILFIRHMGMGVVGAAIATVIAQGISVVLCLIYIIKSARLLIPKREHFAIDVNLYKEMTGQGLSMALMHCLVSAGSAILQSGINNLGYLVIAGHTAARKLYQFGMMLFSAMVQTVSTFVSQNRGANQVGRIRKAMKCAYLYNACATLVITVLLWLFAPYMVRLVSGSAEAVVLENGAMYLRVVAPFYFILGLVNCTRNALQAIGQKVLPVFSSIIELIGKIVFVMVFIPKYAYTAVIFCEPVIWCLMSVELMIAFWNNPYIKAGKEKS